MVGVTVRDRSGKRGWRGVEKTDRTWSPSVGAGCGGNCEQ